MTQPSFPRKFNILVAGLTSPSDPSRGPEGNPRVARGGFTLSLVNTPQGRARMGGPVVPPGPPSALNYTAAIRVLTADYSDAAALVAASGILTFTGNAGDTETVTIDGKIYTFQTVLTNVDGHVFIGASASASLDNLIAAITLGAGAGVAYAAATTLHPTVTAAAGPADTMVATAKVPGTGGNAIATTTTVAGANWSDVTLEGGFSGAPPPLYSKEEIALFDRYIEAGQEFGAGLGDGIGPVAAIATSLATALNTYQGIRALAIADTVFIVFTGPEARLPVKATADMSAVLGSAPFAVYGPGLTLLSVSPRFRKTFFIQNLLRLQTAPVSLPPTT